MGKSEGEIYQSTFLYPFDSKSQIKGLSKKKIYKPKAWKLIRVCLVLAFFCGKQSYHFMVRLGFSIETDTYV